MRKRRIRRKVHHKLYMDNKGYVRSRVKIYKRWVTFGRPNYPSNYYDFM